MKYIFPQDNLRCIKILIKHLKWVLQDRIKWFNWLKLNLITLRFCRWTNLFKMPRSGLSWDWMLVSVAGSPGAHHLVRGWQGAGWWELCYYLLYKALGFSLGSHLKPGLSIHIYTLQGPCLSISNSKPPKGGHDREHCLFECSKTILTGFMKRSLITTDSLRFIPPPPLN